MRARPSWLWSAAGGLVVGLATFAAEGALVFRQNAIGFGLDLEGPYAALFEASRSQLAPLVARIAVAYAVAGIALGCFAALVVRLWAPRRAVAVVGWLGVLAVSAGTLLWERAIVRPALFDDVQWLRPALRWLVDSGEPWHPRVFAAVGLACAVAVGWVRRRTRGELVARFYAGGAMVAVCGLLPWATLLPLESGTADLWRAKRDAPLVILLGVDAFRPDRLKSLGGHGRVAPNIDAFLADATLFTNAWTPIAQTEPAWRSLLTARWPHRTGVRYPLTAESRWIPATTFTEVLTAAGWHTGFATDCSRFHHQPASAGFVERWQPPHGAINFVLEKMRFRALGVVADNALGAAWLPEMVDNRALAGIHDPAGYARRLARTLLDGAGDRPALFAFHATAAHFPGDPVYPFYRKFVRHDAPLERRLRMFFSPIDGGPRAEPEPGGWGRSDSEALYDELLAQADAQIGVILDGLRRRGLYEHAAIILFSDHGESFHTDRPQLAGATPVHGARLSAEENRILLAIKPPNQRREAKVDALVRLVDLGPTIVDLAGLPPLHEVDGTSLVPLLEGRALPPLRLYAETGFTHASPAALDPGHAEYAPRTFDAYRIRPDGVVEMTDAAHEAILREKDVGAFDGRNWIIRSPRSDGGTRESGACTAEARALSTWLDKTSGATLVRRGSSCARQPPG
ncbi:MAG TPA: sulfatase-like hydrolase/transferase [Myxococcaceae bacterium]|nr:sulfatase-like hydrolase/transferase [Myxococcaceae bacterium]